MHEVRVHPLPPLGLLLALILRRVVLHAGRLRDVRDNGTRVVDLLAVHDGHGYLAHAEGGRAR